MNTLLGIALILAVLFGGSILAALRRAYAYVSTRVPSMSGAFTTTIELPAWKALLLIFAFFLISGGVSWQGCKLPDVTTWLPVTTTPLGQVRVLILDETAPAKPLTDEQTQAIRSLDVRAYLDSHTLADSQGGKGWRKEDPNAPFGKLPQEWQTIRANVKPTEFPWVAVADPNGRIIAEGPYPVPLANAVAFFKKYGG